MIIKFINKFLKQRNFLCIELRLKEDGKEYQVIEVEKFDNTLSINSSRTFNDIESLVQNVPKNLPLLLSITGNGIVTKKVNNSTNYRNKLLFNANAEDFYWYEMHQEEYIYASVIRKSILDEEMRELQKYQIYIVDISIGPLVVSAIKPLLPKINYIQTQNFRVDFIGENIEAVNNSTNMDDELVYDIDSERIDFTNIVPFANLVNYIYPNSKISAENDFLKINREEFKYKKSFNTLGMLALPTFLLLLLASYLLLGYYQEKYIALQVKIEEESIVYDKLKLLETDRSNKEAMLKESGLNNSTFLSFYVSKITSQIPAEISLIELSVFSPVEKIKSDQRIIFDNDSISIEGETTSNDDFADWIKIIKTYHWVENLEIIDFRKEGRASVFLIKIKLKKNV